MRQGHKSYIYAAPYQSMTPNDPMHVPIQDTSQTPVAHHRPTTKQPQPQVTPHTNQATSQGTPAHSHARIKQHATKLAVTLINT